MHSFSVITVVKDNADGLRKTLSSIFSQKFSQKDVSLQSIVIDGKSTDGTLEVCSNYPSIDVLISEEDSGIYEAMNKGLYHATREWTMFLNADDTFYNDYTLNNIAEFLTNHNGSGIICGNTIEHFYGQEKIYRHNTIDNMPLHMPACHQSILIKTKVLQAHQFNSTYKICGDLDLMSRLITTHHSILYYPDIIACINGVGVSNRQWETTQQERKKIQQQYYPEKHTELLKYHRMLMVKRVLRSLLPIKLQLIVRKLLHSPPRARIFTAPIIISGIITGIIITGIITI